jgi:hypothetical protein
MEKKKIIKSYENLSPELQGLLKLAYPYGYADKLIRLTNSKNENFFVVPLDAEDVTYMVKVQPPKPKKKVDYDDEFESDDMEDSYNDDDDSMEEDSVEDNANDPSYEPNYEI